MKKSGSLQPVLKWVGGKRQLLPEIVRHLPASYSEYHEPFLGGGAVLFHLRPPVASVNDANGELINVYTTIRDEPEALIESLKVHRNTAEYYYELRDQDRNAAGYARLSPVARASRILFLNRTCYNGLFRVNNAGAFNSPYGRYKKPNIVNESAILAVSDYLRNNNVSIASMDFEASLAGAGASSFVYLDPPYDPVSASANFTGYAKGGFSRADQERLRQACDRLHQRGGSFLLSNSDTAFIRELYAAYSIVSVAAKRRINSNAQGRGCVQEVLIKNYA